VFRSMFGRRTVPLFHRKPSLYGTKPPMKRCKNNHLLYTSILLLVRSADCELNPGPRPPKYPCQMCHKACRMGQHAIACDNCDQLYHVDCLGCQIRTTNSHTMLTLMLAGYAVHADCQTLVHHCLSLSLLIHLTQ
jgi:hypothetical protein